jgi:hypothetical protein
VCPVFSPVPAFSLGKVGRGAGAGRIGSSIKRSTERAMSETKHLYKYLGLKADGSVRADFLENGLFRFTQPDKLNDPFEVRPRVLMEAYSTEDVERARERALEAGFPEDNLDKFLGLFLKTLPRRMTVEEFPALTYPKIPGTEERFRSLAEMDEYKATTRLKDVYEHINKTYGIFSLTTSRSNLTMWSHYAASHQGIVVGFDRDHAFFGNARELQAIDYRDERISLTSNDGYLRLAGKDLPSGSDYKELADQLFLRKHPDWKTEEEWRMIKRLDEANSTSPHDSNVFLYEIPVEAIRVVILGAQISTRNRDNIIALIGTSTKWRHLQILQASLSDTRFGLEFKEVQRMANIVKRN